MHKAHSSSEYYYMMHDSSHISRATHCNASPPTVTPSSSGTQRRESRCLQIRVDLVDVVDELSLQVVPHLGFVFYDDREYCHVIRTRRGAYAYRGASRFAS